MSNEFRLQFVAGKDHIPWFVLLISLSTGALFYYFFRANNIFFSTMGLAQPNIHPLLLVDSLPSLIHVYAMSMLTWLSFGRSKKVVAIMLWVWINLIFEFGQLINEKEMSFLPDILENYCINGAFSWFDVVAIFMGALASYVTLNYFEARGQYV